MPARELITKGVHKDRSGIAIIVSVRGKPREFRKNDKGHRYSDLKLSTLELIAERKHVEARERLKAERADVRGDTLKADVRAFLKMLTGRAKADAENLLSHWESAFRDRRRQTLTVVELRQHAATWRCAASTFNHRRQALITLTVALDGKEALNPARAIPKRQESLHAPRALTYEAIRDVFATMPESQSRARLKLMAYTGLPQMQIEKLAPGDWKGAQLRVTPRRKGAGAAGRWIPISDDAQAALAEFSRLRCWGTFSRSSLWKAWKRYGPAGTNPYSLRHSWITELYRRSNGDVLALKELALHSRLEQTQRYAAAALEDRMTALVFPRPFPTTTKGKVSKTVHNGLQKPKSGTATTQRGNRAGSKKSGRK